MQSGIAVCIMREITEKSEKVEAVRDEDERSDDGEKEEREDENPLAATDVAHWR